VWSLTTLASWAQGESVCVCVCVCGTYSCHVLHGKMVDDVIIWFVVCVHGVYSDSMYVVASWFPEKLERSSECPPEVMSHVDCAAPNSNLRRVSVRTTTASTPIQRMVHLGGASCTVPLRERWSSGDIVDGARPELVTLLCSSKGGLASHRGTPALCASTACVRECVGAPVRTSAMT
jgi:hypothetical protein